MTHKIVSELQRLAQDQEIVEWPSGNPANPLNSEMHENVHHTHACSVSTGTKPSQAQS